MQLNLDEAIGALDSTPASMSQILSGVPDSWVRRTDGPGTWSAYDILGHLVHGELTDWVPRATIILEHGASIPLEPFDREAMFAKTDETARFRLEQFAVLRSKNIEFLRSRVTGGNLERVGTHPTLGTVTLAQLVATWVAHDLTHIAQAAETLARAYRDEVGPWRAFLPALDRVSEAE